MAAEAWVTRSDGVGSGLNGWTVDLSYGFTTNELFGFVNLPMD